MIRNSNVLLLCTRGVCREYILNHVRQNISDDYYLVYNISP